MLSSSRSAWPDYSVEEIEAVQQVLQSNKVNYWTGQICRDFEKEFAAWSNSEFAIALTNGTVALDLALRSLKIGAVNGGDAHDEVIVTPRTFIASVSSVVNAGARPVFADVDRDSGNISAATIESVLTENTKGVIPVHLAGWPCDMGGIMALSQQHGFKVIEDCAQAHGATVDGRSVGSIGHIGAWSFCQDKIMTTGGEGGMVTTNDRGWWSDMWSFKDHGKDWDAVYNQQHPPGFRWLHNSFGTNWRMLEMQAAIGKVQLARMENWTARRTEIALRIADILKRFPGAVRVPMPAAHMKHAFYRLYAYIEPAALKPGWTRDRIVAECTAQDAPLFQGSCSEVYLEKAFDGTDWRPPQRLPTARILGETSLMFLTHPTITEEELVHNCEVFEKVLTEACS